MSIFIEVRTKAKDTPLVGRDQAPGENREVKRNEDNSCENYNNKKVLEIHHVQSAAA